MPAPVGFDKFTGKIREAVGRGIDRRDQWNEYTLKKKFEAAGTGIYELTDQDIQIGNKKFGPAYVAAIQEQGNAKKAQRKSAEEFTKKKNEAELNRMALEAETKIKENYFKTAKGYYDNRETKPEMAKAYQALNTTYAEKMKKYFPEFTGVDFNKAATNKELKDYIESAWATESRSQISSFNPKMSVQEIDMKINAIKRNAEMVGASKDDVKVMTELAGSRRAEILGQKKTMEERGFQKKKLAEERKYQEGQKAVTMYSRDGREAKVRRIDIPKMKEKGFSIVKPAGGTTPETRQALNDYLKSYGAPRDQIGRILAIKNPEQKVGKIRGWLNSRDLAEKSKRFTKNQLDDTEQKILSELQVDIAVVDGIHAARMAGATKAEILRLLQAVVK